MKQKWKRYILGMSLAVITLGVAAFGQSIERVSRRPIVSEAKSKLENVVYWTLVKGQWEKDPVRPRYMEMREVTLGDRSYVILIRHTREGKYRYPEAQLGFYLVDSNRYYLFDKKVLASVINEKTPLNKSYGVDLKVEIRAIGNRTRDTNEMAGDIYRQLEYLDLLRKNVRNPILPAKDLLIAVFPVLYEGKKKIRFDFDEWDTSSMPIKFRPENFDSYYFEVDYDIFYNFFRYDLTEKAANLKQ